MYGPKYGKVSFVLFSIFLFYVNTCLKSKQRISILHCSLRDFYPKHICVILIITSYIGYAKRFVSYQNRKWCLHGKLHSATTPARVSALVTNTASRGHAHRARATRPCPTDLSPPPLPSASARYRTLTSPSSPPLSFSAVPNFDLSLPYASSRYLTDLPFLRCFSAVQDRLRERPHVRHH